MRVAEPKKEQTNVFCKYFPLTRSSWFELIRQHNQTSLCNQSVFFGDTFSLTKVHFVCFYTSERKINYSTLALLLNNSSIKVQCSTQHSIDTITKYYNLHYNNYLLIKAFKVLILILKENRINIYDHPTINASEILTYKGINLKEPKLQKSWLSG